MRHGHESSWGKLINLPVGGENSNSVARPDASLEEAICKVLHTLSPFGLN